MEIDIEELMNNLTSATREDCSSYEWGTRHYDKEIDEAKAAIRNEVSRLYAQRDILRQALKPLVAYIDAGDARSNRLTEIMRNARAALEVKPQ